MQIEQVEQAIKKAKSIRGAAKLLGVSQGVLERWLWKHGLNVQISVSLVSYELTAAGREAAKAVSNG